MKSSQSALTEAILISSLHKTPPQVAKALHRMTGAMNLIKIAANEHNSMKIQTRAIEETTVTTLLGLASELECRSKHQENDAPIEERSAQDIKRIIDCAERLVLGADFRLGGVLHANSKSREIPSKAVSEVKARHLASLRYALGIKLSS